MKHKLMESKDARKKLFIIELFSIIKFHSFEASTTKEDIEAELGFEYFPLRTFPKTFNNKKLNMFYVTKDDYDFLQTIVRLCTLEYFDLIISSHGLNHDQYVEALDLQGNIGVRTLEDSYSKIVEKVAGNYSKIFSFQSKSYSDLVYSSVPIYDNAGRIMKTRKAETMVHGIMTMVHGIMVEEASQRTPKYYESILSKMLD